MQTQTWHDKRREGIGGSDLAKIFGILPRHWKDADALACWEIKTGRRRPKPAGPAARRGNEMEPWVLKEAGERMGLEVAPGPEFVRHLDWPRVRIQANADGLLVWGDRPGLLEAKTVKFSRWPANQGGTCQMILRGEIPPGYALQTQAYLAAMGLEWGILAAAIGPAADYWTANDVRDFKLISFRPNPRAAAIIVEVAQEFWSYVERDQPPYWEVHPLWRELEPELTAKNLQARFARTKHNAA